MPPSLDGAPYIGPTGPELAPSGRRAVVAGCVGILEDQLDRQPTTAEIVSAYNRHHLSAARQYRPVPPTL